MKAHRQLAAATAAFLILTISAGATAQENAQPVFDEAVGVWKDPRSGAWYDEKKGSWMPAETAPAAAQGTADSANPAWAGPAGQISELTDVERIRYVKTTSGEGGRSGVMFRKFLSDPGSEVWYYENQNPDDGFFIRRDSNGNTIETRNKDGDVKSYPGPRGNGVAPGPSELAAGPGARWETVVRTGRDTTRRCRLGATEELAIGSERIAAVRWRCSSQRHDRNLPYVQEFAGVRVNGILAAIEEKRCWTHSHASRTCEHSPGSYDGYAHYLATAIER